MPRISAVNSRLNLAGMTVSKSAPIGGHEVAGNRQAHRWEPSFSARCKKMQYLQKKQQKKYITGYSEVGIALDLGSRDRAFESHYSDQKKPPEMAVFLQLWGKIGENDGRLSVLTAPRQK